MAKHLISFTSARQRIEALGHDGHAAIEETKAAGVYTFDGGIDEAAPPALGLPSHEKAVAWAARIARACRCDQEPRVFMFDPQS